MIISNKKLESAQLDLNEGSIGDYVFKSLRDQRRDNILCDAVVQCGDKEFPVHRSVMYAYSLYCRKLFTGAFPPKAKDGLILIDLQCFSENVVKVFLDIMYGMEGEDSVDIEVEELLKLTDFLQADCDIPVITETLRMMLKIDNCLEIYNLAAAYNFSKLKTVTLTYISGNIQKLTKTDAWKKMDRETLFSLLKEPMIQCKPE